MARLRAFFPMSHGKMRVFSGIIFLNRIGLRWYDVQKKYVPPKSLYNLWRRRSDIGVFARMMDGMATEAADPKTVIIDATHLKTFRAATSLHSKIVKESSRLIGRTKGTVP
jgi:hypothetical protein